jgi:hypothetical protein
MGRDAFLEDLPLIENRDEEKIGGNINCFFKIYDESIMFGWSEEVMKKQMESEKEVEKESKIY